MKVIGLTGGIGSGKSYVAQILRSMGYAVYDSDSRAKALYDEDLGLRRELVQRWGANLYDEHTGRLHRQRLAEIIFTDQEALTQVNALVHPRVRADFKAWIEKQKEQAAAVCFIESAIILGSPLEQMIDELWGVVADEALRLKRAMGRDATTEAAVRSRMARQVDQDSLKSRADFLINNDDNIPLLPQIIARLGRKH